MVGNELLGFGAECYVCEEDVALFGEEEAGEGEIETYWKLLVFID